MRIVAFGSAGDPGQVFPRLMCRPKLTTHVASEKPETQGRQWEDYL